MLTWIMWNVSYADKAEIIIIPCLTDNYSYLIHDLKASAYYVVDACEAQPILDGLGGRALSAILTTHHHWDHVGGNVELARASGCQIYGMDARIPGLSAPVSEGVLKLPGLQCHAIHTPGHTSGQLQYYFPELPALFTGDTLFAMGCGRLFEGTPREMWTSFQKLAALPAETQIFCGHEYAERNLTFAQSLEPDNADLNERAEKIRQLRFENRPTVPFTLEEELRTSPFLRASSVEAFAEIRKLRDGW